jgi:hypothetical protein
MNPILKWYLRVVLSRPIVRAVDWTPEERNAFDLFCRSSCGIKLFEFLRQIVANTTFQAVYKNNVSANAQARGQQDILALLHRLRVFPLEESSFEREFEDSEQPTAARGAPAKGSDNWRWLGGRGAIG